VAQAQPSLPSLVSRRREAQALEPLLPPLAKTLLAPRRREAQALVLRRREEPSLAPRRREAQALLASLGLCPRP
jgi:hypothetical protein